jgi:outer membrane protein
MAARSDGLRAMPSAGCGSFLLGHGVSLAAAVLCLHASGCVSDSIETTEPAPYQQALVEQGPPQRLAPDGLGSLMPAPDPRIPELKVTQDAKTERPSASLSINDALVRALARSPDIIITSFDPAIAKEEVTKAASVFDVTTFGKLSYDQTDDPADNTRLDQFSRGANAAVGLRQKLVTGAEWSLAYNLTRTTDTDATWVPEKSWAPIVSFEVRQPLLRDAWAGVNLAGVDIARLNYEESLLAFRQQAEQVSVEVTAAYWRLWQARRDVDITRELLQTTLNTLQRVGDRKEIDASAVQIKQAEAYSKSRQAELFLAEKHVSDVQDALVRLLSDRQLNLLSDLVLIPSTEPSRGPARFDEYGQLKLALERNAVILQARIGVEVAQVNVRAAERQTSMRLDLVASARTSGAPGSFEDSHKDVGDGDFVSYSVGVNLEYPLGNRERKAELQRRKLEHDKAETAVRKASDQVTIELRERIRRAEVAQKEMHVQRDAIEAATAYLSALEDTEQIRDRLTPEFILLKLQAQELLARAQRDEARAIVDFNTAQAQLAQSTGTILDIRCLQRVFPEIPTPERGNGVGNSGSAARGGYRVPPSGAAAGSAPPGPAESAKP